MSNVFGVVNPVKEIIKVARKINPNIIVVIDAAQASPHHQIDVVDLDCDFLAFSSHKMLGPTGAGVLWGRKKILENMAPFNFGGDMIEEVRIDKTTFAKLPAKFEAGTPDIAGVIGLGVAIEYINKVGLKNFSYIEKELTKYATIQLKNHFGESIKIYSTQDEENRVGIVTFTIDSIHSHDLGQILADENICIRVGHHCTQPLHTRLGITASCRASFYLYNTKEDVDKLVEGIAKAIKFFQ